MLNDFDYIELAIFIKNRWKCRHKSGHLALIHEFLLLKDKNMDPLKASNLFGDLVDLGVLKKKSNDEYDGMYIVNFSRTLARRSKYEMAHK